VPLPPPARDLALRRATALPFADLKRAAAALSALYRDRAPRLSGLSPELRVAAYLVTRMPATYAAAAAVLSEVRARTAAPIASVLDIGAGTGAASLAARAAFPLARLTLCEPDPAFAQAARELLPEALWQPSDFTSPAPFPAHDLVVAAYSLGEVPTPAALEAALRMWEAARVALAIVQPGTPAGFSLVRQVRDRLLTAGAHMLAPCPSSAACPMRDPDWCHFSARTDRSSLHRRLKDAALGYEDEKFSYIAFSRTPVPLAPARILRHPLHRPGLITFELCEAPRVVSISIPHSDRLLFRAARRASWGASWPS